jgi:hypothetical protein
MCYPPNPLPADAPQPWHDLWVSVRLVHERAPEAFLHAWQAGVDPSGLVWLQLAAPEGTDWPMPRLAFCATFQGPARVFGPDGEVF